MSIDEKDKVIIADLAPTKAVTRDETIFLKQILAGSEKDLARPIGEPNWFLTLPALLCVVIAILLFVRIVDLGVIPVAWTIQFNVNIATALIALLAGALPLFARVRKNVKEWRSRNTLISFGILILVVGLFLSNLLNLGTFTYTLEGLDVNSIVGLLLVGVVILCSFRGSKVAGGLLLVLFVWWGISIKDFNLFIMFGDLFTSENGARLMRTLMPPNWDYFKNVIEPMFITVQTAIVATLIGIIGALPLSILAARNTSPHPVIYNTIRLLVNSLRAIPALILALLFIPFVGLGPGAGILGLGIHTIAVLTKLYAEAFEAVKPEPVEALSAVGANGLKAFRWGVFPQAYPLLASYSIFSWESNGRDSTVVAFVGGGGIGFLLQMHLSLLDYANVSVLLVMLVLTVSLLDRLSDFVRSKII